MTAASASAAAAPHIPVLAEEVVHALAVAPGETHVDGTFGAGGYAKAILEKGAARVIAFDRDPEAIQAGETLVASSGERLTLVPERFSRMRQALTARGIDQVDGVTLDVGVSSMQLDRPERGFSFQGDGPLDMRMGKDGPSAADFVNRADEAEIADILFHYGEEPKSRRVARAIVAARPIARTGELAEVVRKALGHHPGMKKDPATRTFQAIRIHVNEELQELEGGLAAAEQVLRPGGRLAVVTFHSLEDRIVKRFLKRRSGALAGGSRHRPAANLTGPAPTFEAVGRPVKASEAEVEGQSPGALGDIARRAPHRRPRLGLERGRKRAMIARGFKPVVWVAAVGAAALGCYMLSLRVAAERADLTSLQHRIVPPSSRSARSRPRSARAAASPSSSSGTTRCSRWRRHRRASSSRARSSPASRPMTARRSTARPWSRPPRPTPRPRRRRAAAAPRPLRWRSMRWPRPPPSPPRRRSARRPSSAPA